MGDTPNRRPIAIANWKMAMTIFESLAFVRAFRTAVGHLAQEVTVVLCPAYTALHAVGLGLDGSPIALGAQNLHAGAEKAHTGEISARLLADIGCQWVLLGHWEVRRQTGEDDADVNLKIHAALQANLRPIPLIGEAADEQGQAEEVLAARLPAIFAGCSPAQVSRMAVIYEPEWAIGAEAPASPDVVASGCRYIREWVAQTFDDGAAEALPIAYGGSVTPRFAGDLLASPDVDGLGATRQGRRPIAFADIVSLIAAAKRVV